MRQVPNTKNIYLIVGSGRLARHLEAYFNFHNKSNSNIHFTQWSRKTHSLEALKPKAQEATKILLCVKDSALEGFVADHLIPFRDRCVHFSGSLHIEGLANLHPLMTFADSLYDLNTYQKTPFAYFDKTQNFKSIFPELNNPSFFVESSQKPLYHALCVVAGNFSSMLWLECLKRFAELGVDKNHLELYAKASLENTFTLGENGLTGPLIRKDYATVQGNLRALQNSNLALVYESFIWSFTPELLKTHKELK